MKITVVGIPLTCGGANTELGHTILLWRSAGIEVTVAEILSCNCGKPIEVWSPDNPWHDRLEKAGCLFERIGMENLDQFSGRVLSGFCNQHCAHLWPALSQRGCKLVWSPCMNYMGRHEHFAFRLAPPTCVHFQSSYQAGVLCGEYEELGCSSTKVIHGAFDPLPFRPLRHHEGEPFVVGRLARPVRTKWSPDLWEMLGAVRDLGVDVRALCMGWDEMLSHHCGKPPEWAECLPSDSIPAEEFLSRCHALICANWSDVENWPRVGLEAMSAGVPVIADNAGGWKEMVLDGETGLLCGKHEFVPAMEWLATSEEDRQNLIGQARTYLGELTDRAKIGEQWTRLLTRLG